MANIMLYGGCVIRDAYELIKSDVGLSGYVARQSLISAMNPPVKEVPGVDLKAGFESRMASEDLRSTLVGRLRKAAETADLIVMDCHIERVGVHRLPDGSFFTPTTELRNTGLLNQLRAKATKVPIGSPRHTGLWTAAADRLAARLDQFGLLDRTMVVNAPWAKVDNLGVPLEDFQGRPASEVSDEVTALTRILRDRGIRVVDMPEELAIADVDHKWTRSPFHFGEEAMRWVADQMIGSIK